MARGDVTSDAPLDEKVGLAESDPSGLKSNEGDKKEKISKKKIPSPKQGELVPPQAKSPGAVPQRSPLNLCSWPVPLFLPRNYNFMLNPIYIRYRI